MQSYVDNAQGQPDSVDVRETEPRRVTMAGIFRVPDAMWERIEPLVPAPGKVHPFGGGAPRIADRVVLDAIFFVLRTGCQWHALDATGICSGSTAHRRFQEWEQAGFFDALWVAALQDYDTEQPYASRPPGVIPPPAQMRVSSGPAGRSNRQAAVIAPSANQREAEEPPAAGGTLRVMWRSRRRAAAYSLSEDLEPVGSLSITTLVDNVADILLLDEGPAIRAPRVPSHVIEGGQTLDALRAEHGFAALVTISQRGREHRVTGMPLTLTPGPGSAFPNTQLAAPSRRSRLLHARVAAARSATSWLSRFGA